MRNYNLELTTTTLLDASRTWITGALYRGAILTAVCVLQWKRKRVSISQLEKTKNKKNQKNTKTTQKPDKTPTEIISDLMHRPELQKKKAINPSAMHRWLNTDFNNKYINTFPQRVSECFINNMPTHIPSLFYQLTENQQLISLSLRKFQWELKFFFKSFLLILYFSLPHASFWVYGLALTCFSDDYSISTMLYFKIGGTTRLLTWRRNSSSGQQILQTCTCLVSQVIHIKNSQFIQSFSIYSYSSPHWNTSAYNEESIIHHSTLLIKLKFGVLNWGLSYHVKCSWLPLLLRVLANCASKCRDKDPAGQSSVCFLKC